MVIRKRSFIFSFNMKKFIKKLIVLIVILVIILTAIEKSLRVIPNDYSYKSEWLEKNADSLVIWTFGSSHGYFGIEPQYFDKKSFNSAHVAQGTKFDNFIFNRYFNYMNSLKTVILPISYFSLRSNMEDEIEKWRVPNYHIYYDYKPVKFLYHFKMNNEKNPINRAVKSLIGIENERICSDLGWGTSHVLANRSIDWENCGLRSSKMQTKSNFSNDTYRQNEEYIIDICQKCKDRNIDIILLTTPTHKSYYRLLDSIQLTEIIEFCKTMECKFDNVKYVNLLKDNRFTVDDFYDSDHVNEYGAKKLTLIINDTLNCI